MGSLFPVVINAFGVAIKKFQQVLVGRSFIEIVPFLCRMDAQPLLLVLDVLIATKRASSVYTGGVTRKDICWDINVFNLCTLVLPVFVHIRVFLKHFNNVLLLVMPWRSCIRPKFVCLAFRLQTHQKTCRLENSKTACKAHRLCKASPYKNHSHPRMGLCSSNGEAFQRQ